MLGCAQLATLANGFALWCYPKGGKGKRGGRLSVISCTDGETGREHTGQFIQQRAQVSLISCRPNIVRLRRRGWVAVRHTTWTLAACSHSTVGRHRQQSHREGTRGGPKTSRSTACVFYFPNSKKKPQHRDDRSEKHLHLSSHAQFNDCMSDFKGNLKGHV